MEGPAASVRGVLPQSHVGEIRQVLAAPHHVDAVAQLVGVPLLQAAHQRRQLWGVDV